MSFSIGILFALVAMLFWGFGDFLIQRSTRKFGDWETLFIIDALGMVALTPFVYKDFPTLFEVNITWVLLAASALITIAAILDFEALKRGKIAVVEPVYALEVPVAALFAFTIIGETVQTTEALLIAVLLAGLVAVSLRSHHFERKSWLEKGVLLAVIGTIFMGATNFFVGFASRVANPLFVIWFTSLFTVIISLFYLSKKKRMRKLVSDVKHNMKLALSVSTLDNAAWIAFAFAASLASIPIVVAISESYIVLVALLGLLINHERLMLHQKVGLVIALATAIVLAVITA